MQDWWRSAIIYQVYPRSFQDTSGNGTGDLKGITQRLEHIASLSADAVWLSPFFKSPDKDMGYDVSGYTEVSELFGTIEDFDALVARAHELGLRVIIDQVLSHTSNEHPWFAESRQDRTNPKADWYVWADPKRDGTPPTNWPSVFGGSAWQFDAVRRQYYLHNFLTEQPDLNFHNPEVVSALLDAMRFWLERGVDGFRLDTVNFYVHDAQLRDNPPSDWTDFPGNPYEAQTHVHSKTQPENLGVLERIRALVDEYEDRMLIGEVGEAGQRQVEIMGEYTAGSTRLHMAYSFAMLGPDRSPEHFRNCIEGFETHAPDGWPSWSFSNHDVTRHVTRWTREGGDTAAIAKQSVAMLCAFPGALGIYQGEELGQTETDILWEELTDLGYIDFWPDYKGRDGCRTPMVWEAAAPNAGFSGGTPWLPVKPPQAANAVDLQEGDPGSVLHAYRAAIAFRKSRPELTGGTTAFPPAPNGVLAVSRSKDGKTVTGLFNLVDQAVTLEGVAGQQVGPAGGAVDGGRITLPEAGFVYIETAEIPERFTNL